MENARANYEQEQAQIPRNEPSPDECPGVLLPQPRSDLNYRKVFQDYYYRLSKTLPTADLLPSLLSIEVITMDQKEEIQAKETSGMRACTLLDGPIWSGINSGYPDAFIRLLCLMRLIHNPSCEKLSEEISGHLNISDDVIKEVMSSICSKWCYYNIVAACFGAF